MKHPTRWRTVLGMILLVGALAGCRFGTNEVSLRYRFPPGSKHHYIWTMTSITRTDSPNETSVHSRKMIVDVEETASRKKGAVLLRLFIQPKESIEDGARVDPGPPTSLEVNLDQSGRVLRTQPVPVLAQGTAIDLNAFAYQLRPLLPVLPVAVGETWAAVTLRAGGAAVPDLKGSSRLKGFSLKDRRRLADLITIQHGSVSGDQMVGRAKARLNGTIRSRLWSSIDVDHQVLYSSKGLSTSTFDVTLSTGATAGKVTVELETSVRLIS